MFGIIKPNFKLDLDLVPRGLCSFIGDDSALMGASGAAAFLPTDVAGLTGWYDAGVGITKDGSDKVTDWADQSGAGNDLAKVGATGPLWVASALGGKPTVRFAANSEGLDITPYGAALTQPLTIFTVTKVNTIGASDQYIFDTQSSGVNRNFCAVQDQTPHQRNLSGDIDGSLLVQATTGQVNTFLLNGTSSQTWTDGVSDDTGNSGTNSQGGLTLGTRFNATSHFNGDISEFLIYDADVTGGVDQTNIETYLKDKYGL